MHLGVVLWKEQHTPKATELRDRMKDDGFDVIDWSDPAGAVYQPHAHNHDEVIVPYDGRIEFIIEGQNYLLDPGDALFLPKGTIHSARVGGDGASYLIGQPSTR